MKKIYILVITMTLVSCTPMRKLYVKYGEAKPKLENEDRSVMRIFFDRYGTLYPNITISDTKIMDNDSDLDMVYKNNKDLLQLACISNGLPADGTADMLQQKIIDDILKQINLAAKNKQVILLIHGFNKHPFKPIDSNSVAEFKLMREKIVNTYPNKQFQFVEVYWDGCTWANGSDSELIKARNSIKIWDNAQAASNFVGVELRKILTKIDNDDTIVITHSLGASVITTALFNVDKFDLEKKDNDFRKEILKAYEKTDTPTKKFRIGMLAAAIPGENTFDDYLKRTPEKSIIFDNYDFVLGYNTNDFIITKWILAGKFGSTTLGSRLNEINATNTILKGFKVKQIEPISFSFYSNDTPQKEHAFRAYIANTKAMDIFLDKLLK